MLHDSENIIYSAENVVPIKKSYGQAIYEGLLNGGFKTALVDAYTSKEVTYSTLLERTLKMAAFFKEYGLKEKDVICICASNSMEIFIPSIAALYLGLVVAPINPAYMSREIIHVLNISKPKLVFCTIETLNKIEEAIKAVSSVEKIILFGETKVKSLDNLQELLLRNSPMDPLDMWNGDPDHIAGILCSSGTTGPSKGVMLSHKNFLIAAVLMGQDKYYALNADHIMIGILPFFHAYALNLYLTAFILNMKFILINKFNEKVFLSSIEKYKVTFAPLVPPVVVLLAKSPLVEQYDLSSIRDIVCGAAPLKREIEELVTKKLNILTIRQLLGLTESCFCITAQPIGEKNHGSVGRLVPGLMAKIVDPHTGKALGPEEPGELCIKGEMLSKGYYEDEAATSALIDKDGWMHTGDLGYYDEEHSFFIMDRLKELIKFKGFQVPPAELEGLLLMHPKIKDVAVIGQYDEKYGELPVAFVVKLPNENLTEQDVIRYVADNVCYQKQLHGGVKFVDEIPKSPSGKILRRLLKESLKTQASLKKEIIELPK